MKEQINKRIAQNYLIKNQAIGSVILMLFCFGFLILFKPLNPNDSKHFGYEGAMAAYSFLVGCTHFVLSLVLKRIEYFAAVKSWTLKKEIFYILLDLLAFGITVYFSGFLIEINDPVLWVSFRDAALIGMVPLIFFTLININGVFQEYTIDKDVPQKQPEEKIKIISRLKGEELEVYPRELVYIESNGNYVNFYLKRTVSTKKVTIRNSISAIETQLKDYPFMLRTHRAFIVNLKKVTSQRGNALGYKLSVSDFGNMIPVSRNKINDFNKEIRKYSK